MSMQQSNDTIENRTRDLPACSAVSQPTALPRIVQYIRSHKRTDQLLASGPCENLTVSFRIIKLTRGVHRLQIAEYVRR